MFFLRISSFASRYENVEVNILLRISSLSVYDSELELEKAKRKRSFLMNTDPKVLIVTSAFGDGHLKVAEAIDHSFRRRGISRIVTLDLFAAVYPTLNELSRRFYLNSTGYTQEFYGLVYKLTSKMNPDQFMGRWIHSMGKRKVQRIIDEIGPDIIIHTFPYLAAAELASTKGDGSPFSLS